MDIVPKEHVKAIIFYARWGQVRDLEKHVDGPGFSIETMERLLIAFFKWHSIAQPTFSYRKPKVFELYRFADSIRRFGPAAFFSGEHWEAKNKDVVICGRRTRYRRSTNVIPQVNTS